MSCQALNGDATMVLDNHVSYISANPTPNYISGIRLFGNLGDT